jgi:ACT domain-containing protein
MKVVNAIHVGGKSKGMRNIARTKKVRLRQSAYYFVEDEVFEVLQACLLQRRQRVVLHVVPNTWSKSRRAKQ